MKRYVALVLAAFLLISCGSTQVVNSPTLYDRPTIELTNPQPVQQLPIDWFVITQENLEQKIAEIRAKNTSFVVIAVTPQGYQNMSMNEAELRRYIRQQEVLIASYRKYYESQNVKEKEIQKEKSFWEFW